MALTIDENRKIGESLAPELAGENGTLSMSELKELAKGITDFIKNPDIEHSEITKEVNYTFEQMYKHPEKIIKTLDLNKQLHRHEDLARPTKGEVRSSMIKFVDKFIAEEITANGSTDLDEEQAKLYVKQTKQQIGWDAKALHKLIKNSADSGIEIKKNNSDEVSLLEELNVLTLEDLNDILIEIRGGVNERRILLNFLDLHLNSLFTSGQIPRSTMESFRGYVEMQISNEFVEINNQIRLLGDYEFLIENEIRNRNTSQTEVQSEANNRDEIRSEIISEDASFGLFSTQGSLDTNESVAQTGVNDEEIISDNVPFDDISSDGSLTALSTPMNMDTDSFESFSDRESHHSDRSISSIERSLNGLLESALAGFTELTSAEGQISPLESPTRVEIPNNRDTAYGSEAEYPSGEEREDIEQQRNYDLLFPEAATIISGEESVSSVGIEFVSSGEEEQQQNNLLFPGQETASSEGFRSVELEPLGLLATTAQNSYVNSTVVRQRRGLFSRFFNRNRNNSERRAASTPTNPSNSTESTRSPRSRRRGRKMGR